MASTGSASHSAPGQDDSGCVQDEPSPCKSDAEPPPQVNLLDLSDDVLLWILQYCEACDLKALGFSCRRLGLLVCDRSLWCRVRAHVRPCGAARLRWILALMHEQSRALSVAGHALTTRKPDQDNSSDEESGLSRDRCGHCDGEIGPSSSSHAQPQDDPWRLGLNNFCPGLRLPMRQNDAYFETYQPTRSAESSDPEAIYTATPTLLKQLTARCPQLHTLELTYCNVDWCVTNMSQFPPTLKRLSLRGCKSYGLPADKSCMFRVNQHLPLLEDLDLSSFDGVEGLTLLPLSKLPSLRRLLLRNCKRLREFVAYASLAARYGFRQLQALDVRGSTFSDSEISAFGWLPLLEELYISPEHVEKASPFDADVIGTELDPWELEEPAYYRDRRLPSPLPESPPPPPTTSVFTVTIDRGHEHRRVNLQVDENGGAGDGHHAAGRGNGHRLAGDEAMELGVQEEGLARRNGVRRNIRGRDVIFFVGGNHAIDGLPGNIGGEGNVIIVVGARNENRNADNAAPRNDAPENGVPRNSAPENGVPRNNAPENGVPRNDAPEIGVLGIDAVDVGDLRNDVLENAVPGVVLPENVAQRTNAPGSAALRNSTPETSAPKTYTPENVAPTIDALDGATSSKGTRSSTQNSPIKNHHPESSDNEEDGNPPAKKQRMSARSVHSNENSMDGSNASVDPNIGSPSSSVDHNVGSSNFSVDPNVGSSNSSVDHNVGSPNSSVDQNVCSSNASVDHDVGSSNASVDPNVGSSNSSVDHNVGSSNASVENCAGSSIDTGPAANESRPRRYVKFRRNLPPVVVTENEPDRIVPLVVGPNANAPGLNANVLGHNANDANDLGRDANVCGNHANDLQRHANVLERHANVNGRHANDLRRQANVLGCHANDLERDANDLGRGANDLGRDANVPSPHRANEGQIRQPNPIRGIHVQRPLQNHRFFIQIENEHLENDRPYRRREYRTPLARHARRIPGCLLGMRSDHPPIHPALLVTDASLKKFGHSDDENEHVIRIDQLGAAVGNSDRPHKSKLRRLICSGYVRVTNRSLAHLATAAPDLVFVDVRGTKVNEDGVKAFKALRPDCEVLYETVVVDT